MTLRSLLGPHPYAVGRGRGAMKHRFDLYVRYTIEIDLPNPITTLEGLNGHLICKHFLHSPAGIQPYMVGSFGAHRWFRAIYSNEARMPAYILKLVYTFYRFRGLPAHL